jgi:hypothetical protein
MIRVNWIIVLVNLLHLDVHLALELIRKNDARLIILNFFLHGRVDRGSRRHRGVGLGCLGNAKRAAENAIYSREEPMGIGNFVTRADEGTINKDGDNLLQLSFSLLILVFIGTRKLLDAAEKTYQMVKSMIKS